MPAHRPADDNLHQSVQTAIKAYILDNGLKTGDPVKPEMEFSRDLGVSRNSVREAVKVLESLGVIEARRGSGIFVGHFSFEPLLDNLPYALMKNLDGLEDLMDIRQLLEVGMAERIVAALTRDQLRALRSVTEAMRAKTELGETFSEQDREFHRLLNANVDNKIHHQLLDVFWLAFRRASEHVDIHTPRPEKTLQDHVAIVDALQAKNAARLRQAVEEHYKDIRNRLAATPRVGKHD